MNEQLSTPTERQAAYLRHLAARAHGSGMPHLYIEHFTRVQAAAWIDYLRIVVAAEERVREILDRAKRQAEQSTPYLVTPPSDQLPASYRPAWQDLPQADDHEHLVGSVKREDEAAVPIIKFALAPVEEVRRRVLGVGAPAIPRKECEQVRDDCFG